MVSLKFEADENARMKGESDAEEDVNDKTSVLWSHIVKQKDDLPMEDVIDKAVDSMWAGDYTDNIPRDLLNNVEEIVMNQDDKCKSKNNEMIHNKKCDDLEKEISMEIYDEYVKSYRNTVKKRLIK